MMYVTWASCLQVVQNSLRRSAWTAARSKVVDCLIFSFRASWKLVTNVAVSDLSNSRSLLFSSRKLPWRTKLLRADLGMYPSSSKFESEASYRFSRFFNLTNLKQRSIAKDCVVLGSDANEEDVCCWRAWVGVSPKGVLVIVRTGGSKRARLLVLSLVADSVITCVCVSVCVCESEYECSVVCVVCDECVTLHYFLIYYVSNVPKLQLGKTQSRKGAFVVTSSVSFVRPESVEDANQPIRILATRRTCLGNTVTETVR